jgi:predicted ATPase
LLSFYLLELNVFFKLEAVTKLHLRNLRWNESRWRDDLHPFRVPAVQHVKKHGLEFKTPITFFVGENGSGKTTILEAIAARYPRIGSASPFSNRTGTQLSFEDVPLAWNADLACSSTATTEGFFLRASTLGALIGDLDREAKPTPRAGDRPLSRRSHGEGLLGLLNGHFESKGMYFLDEPETALSFNATLGLVGLLATLGKNGSQVVAATHSPIVLSVPGATILEFGDFGIREVLKNDLELFRDWQSFLERPEVWLRHLLDEPRDTNQS